MVYSTPDKKKEERGNLIMVISCICTTNMIVQIYLSPKLCNIFFYTALTSYPVT